MIEISEGKTNNYLVHGIGAVVFSVFVLYLSSVFSDVLLIVALAIFIVAILLFSATNGLEIDIDNNKFRKYGNIRLMKFGAWTTLVNPDKVILRMHAANASRNYMTPIAVPMPSMDSRSITYDIVLTDSLDDEQVLYDFLDYKKAKEALSKISEHYQIPAKNKVAEKMVENRAKRRR